MNTTEQQSLSIENRNQAYFSIIESLPKKRKRIFYCIQQNPNSTAVDISTNYNIPINEVVPRITELKNYFLITESGSQTNQKSKKQNTIYKAVENLSQRIDLINARFVELRTNKETLERDYILGVSNLTRDLIQKQINKINIEIKMLEYILDTIKN